MSIEVTSGAREQIRFVKKHADKIKDLLKKTHFTVNELNAVFLIYYKLQKDAGEKAQAITRMQFKTILNYTFHIPDFLMERIFVALEKVVTPHVSLETWTKTLSLYLRGTLDEKITYCFTVYDVLAEGIIRRNQLITLLRNSIIKQHEEDVHEATKDFVDILINKMDLDKDGAISFNDYQQSIYQTPLLLECFGQCLPDRDSVYAFLVTFTDKINKY